MKHFSFMPHTADVRLIAKGSSYEELFQASLEGMASLLSHKQRLTSTSECTHITISAPDISLLLIDFLSRVLTISLVEQVLFTRITFDEISDTSLCATIHGNKVERFDEDIKAVTYHEAYVAKDKDGTYVVTIVFDI